MFARLSCKSPPWLLIRPLDFGFVAVEVGALGDTMKRSLVKASATLVKVVPGLTEDSVAKWKLALEEPEHELRLRVYFLVARKR